MSTETEPAAASDGAASVRASDAAAMSVPERVSFRDAARVWALIGLLSFGGPAGQIAVMHRELVEKRRWVDESRFLHALNYCMLLPGPEAQQLVTYVGWLLHRTRGGLVAGSLFVLPGFVAILALSIVYALYREVALVSGVVFGLKCAVLAIVAHAVVRIGRRALKTRALVLLAALSFVAIFFFAVPFPIIVVGVAIAGLVGSTVQPAWFPATGHGGATGGGGSLLDAMAARGELEHTRPSRARAVATLVTGLVAWWAPVGVLAAFLGSDSVFVEEGVFFSQAALVTFGGAYAVLAYIAQRAVYDFGWLAPGEMADGLGLAETTPGPLIMVVQFVAFMGAYRDPGGLSPLAAGVAGSIVTVWVTFAPCFLWIFLGAPYIEALRGSQRLGAALSAITAAVVGVVLNLSVWFALHVCFGAVTEHVVGPLTLLVPALETVNVAAVVLSVGAIVALFRFEVGVLRLLAATALLGLGWTLLV